MKTVKTMIAALIFLSATGASAQCKNQSSAGRFASTAFSVAKTTASAQSSATAETPSQTGKK